MVVNPASWDFEAVEGGDTGLGEEGGEEVANDTTDTVSGEDLSESEQRDERMN